MAKAKSKNNTKALSRRVIFATTALLLTGALIIFAGWLLDNNLGLLLIGFGSALLFISAILYWLVIKVD